MSKFLIVLGLILLVAGLAWPLISQIGLGKLPGDIHIEREGFSFYFPLTTSILISIFLSLVFWLFSR